MNRVSVGVLCLVLLPAGSAVAQPREPVSRFVVDAHGLLARFKGDAAVASGLGVTAENLPTRGLGLGVGAHWYPLRGRLVSLGLGGELVIARDRRTPAQTGEATTPLPTVTTRFSSVSPHVSLNFGKRDGWSYLSGGIGRARLTSERDDLPAAGSAEGARTINYGGGARWFTGPHLAFSFDLRWYTVDARAATAAQPGYPRSRMMVFSAGISLH